MKRKMLAVVLAAALVIGVIPFGAFTVDASNMKAIGNYLVNYISDGDTSTPPTTTDVNATDGSFGSASADGRVWTDKTVNVNNGKNGFDITLSALTQEYTVESGTSLEESHVAVDAVLLIDLTNSMTTGTLSEEGSSSTVYYSYATVQALNNALDTILCGTTDAEKNDRKDNRVAVYGYTTHSESTSAGWVSQMKCYTILPLGHYESTTSTVWKKTSKGGTGKYFDYTSSSKTISANSGLNVVTDGTSTSYSSSVVFEGGTNTQYGIVKSIGDVISEINAETSNINQGKTDAADCKERWPYMLLLTDGQNMCANECWFADTYPDDFYGGYTYNSKSYTQLSPLSTGYMESSITGTVTSDITNTTMNKSDMKYSEICALTVLSCAKAKDDLRDAYAEYNKAVNGSEVSDEFKAEWFNIALVTDGEDPEEDVEENITSILTPSRVAAAETDFTKQTQAYIDAYTNVTNTTKPKIITYGNKYTSVAPGLKSIAITAADEGYIDAVPSDYSGWTKYGDTEDGAEYPNYVYTTNNIYYTDTTEDLTEAFTDLADSIAERSRTKYNPVTDIEGNSAAGKMIFTDTYDSTKLDLGAIKLNGIEGETTDNINYTFEGYESTVTVSGGTVTWTIPSEEVPMFSYKSYTDRNKGYDEAAPIKLTYSVDLKSDAVITNDTPIYSNAFSKDKSTGVITAGAEVVYYIMGGNPYYYDTTASTDVKTSVKSATAKKTDANVTETATYSVSPSFVKTADSTTYHKVTDKLGNNGEVEPILRITKTANPTTASAGEEVTYTVTVKNLSDETITSIVVKDELPDGLESTDSYNGTQTILSIAAGEEGSKTFTAKVKEDTPDGTLTNTAYITSVGGKALTEQPSATADLTVESKYGVTYNWTGDIPTGVTLPINGSSYTVGESYEVDDTYGSTYTKEVKDAYGNVTDKWTFSGWTDPGNGKMPAGGVTITGEWRHTEITVPANKVTYEWSGLPDEAVIQGTTDKPLLPTDSNSYVPNQPYTVDETCTSATVAVITDEYGNITKKYTFSGWNDPNDGLMDADGVTITGTWTEETVTVEKYGVTYNWGTAGVDAPPANAVSKADSTSKVTLPTESTRYVTNEPYGDDIDTTYTDGFVAVEYDDYGNITDTWTFSGWTAENGGKMPEGGADVTGSWTHKVETVPSGTVTYKYTGNVPEDYSGKEPTDSNTYVKGQGYTVSSTPASGTKVPHYNDNGNIDGYYTFEGWSDPNNGVMDEDGVTVTGNWTYEEITVPKYSITYSWEAYDENGSKTEVPADCGEIPADITNAYEKNQAFKSDIDTTYTKGKSVDTKDIYNNITGTWTFSGWETIPEDNKMPEGGVALNGKWTYVKKDVDTNSVVYRWTSAPESGAVIEGSEETVITLPSDTNDYVPSQPYSIDETFKTGTTAVKKDVYGNITDRWTFSGWTDTNSTPGVMDADGAVITGTWVYEKVEVTPHKVIYEWTGLPDDAIIDGTTPIKPTVPTDSNTYVPNQSYEVNDTYTSTTVAVVKDTYGNVIKKYTFSGWTDPNNGKMGNSDITVTGTWTEESVTTDTYSIAYVFDTDAPEGVLPTTDSDEYVVNQPFTREGTYEDVNVYDDYNNVKGIWHFNGWTKVTNDSTSEALSEDKMPASDITIHGEWTYTPKTVPTGKVTYVFSGDAPEGVTPPTDDTTYTKGQSYELKDEPEDVPTCDEYGNQNGIWEFQKWDDPNSGVMDEDGVTVTGTWKYTAQEVPEYGVTYEWTGDVPSTENLPNDDDTYVIGESYSVDGTYTSKTVIPVKDGWGNVTGNYTFSGWTDPANGKMVENGVTIKGVWTYADQDVPANKVTYTYTGSVPPALNAPVDNDTYVPNQTYTLKGDPAPVKTYDTYGNETGVYTFEGWVDPNNGVMDNDGVEVTGNWIYTPTEVPTYSITYVFDTDSPENANPTEDTATYVNNQPFTREGTYEDVNVYDDYNNVKGIWHFNGWTKVTNNSSTAALTEDKIPGADITIHGEWTYTPQEVPTGKVTYEFDGESPKGVIPPEDENTYTKGQSYELKDEPEDVPTYDEYNNQNGIWTFNGWEDPNSGTMGDGDVTVTGKWTYTAIDVPEYGVTYEWTGDIPSGKILPTNDETYVKGEPYSVDTAFPANYTVETRDTYGNLTGIYTFSGWTDPGEGIMPEGGVKITGNWTYRKIDVIPGNVTYTFTGTVPPEVSVPVDGNSYVPGQQYDLQPEPEDGIKTYDQYGNVTGEYTFNGWVDPNGGKMTEGGVSVTGEWIYTPQEVPTHKVEWPEDPQDPESKTKEIDITNGAYIIVDPNSGIWDHEGTPHNDVTNVTIVEDLMIEDPQKDNYTFTGWTVTVEDGITTYTANWEINDRDVTFTPDPEDDDPSGKVTVTKGTVITVDPNKGEWTHEGTTHTDKTQITINDDTVIADPIRDGYEFTGWTKTIDEDGNITLTAQWKLRIDIPAWIIPATIIGGGVTAGVVAVGSAIAIPIIAVGAVVAGTAIKDNIDEEEHEQEDIPYTGSDMTVTFAATGLAIISMAAIVYLIIDKKKRNKEQTAE